MLEITGISIVLLIALGGYTLFIYKLFELATAMVQKVHKGLPVVSTLKKSSGLILDEAMREKKIQEAKNELRKGPGTQSNW